MNTLQRTSINASDRLNRVFQEVNRKVDYEGVLGTIRHIYGTNMDENGELITNTGAKSQDDVFTVLVEFPFHPRGLMSMSLTLKGSYAENAVRDGLKVKDQIRFDAHAAGKIEDGRLVRKPYLVATWYEKVVIKSEEAIPGTEQI